LTQSIEPGFLSQTSVISNNGAWLLFCTTNFPELAAASVEHPAAGIIAVMTARRAKIKYFHFKAILLKHNYNAKQ
jgi:hypothetical protein